MKTIKHTLLFTATVFAATTSFAQLGLGLRGNAGASALKTVNAAHATTRAANVATRASAQATVNAQRAVQAAGSRAAEVKTTAGATGHAVAAKSMNASEEKRAINQVIKANAGVGSEGGVHASGNGKEGRNEHSTLKTSASASVENEASISVDRPQDNDARDGMKETGDKALRIKAKAERKAAAKAARAEEKAEKEKDRTISEGRDKAQASVKASENAKEHANEHSAVFGAKSDVSSENTIKKSKKGASASSNTEVRAKGKASKS